ncbi:MAG: PAS domain S-box protein [bacterium]
MISKKIKILLFEVNCGDARLIEQVLSEAKGVRFQLKCVDRLSTGLELLDEESFDIVLLDISLPDSFGFETFTRIRSQVPNMPIIILSGLEDELMAIKAVQEGAQDYLFKTEVSTNLLIHAIRYGIERKRIADALHDSERQYRSTINSMRDAIHVIDSDLRIVLLNDAFKQLNKKLGLSTDIIGKDVFEVFSFLPDSVRDEYQKVFDTGKTIITEEETKIGVEEFITETRKLPVYEGGKVSRIITIVRDITKRKKAEEELRDSESKFRTLAENCPNMIFINMNGRIVYANKRCEEIMGYKKEEFYSSGFDFLTLVASGSRKTLKSNFRKHMKGEAIPPFEIIIITRADKRIESLFTTRLIDYEGEKAILGIVTDISKLKEAERILKQGKETFGRLVDQRTKQLVEIQKKLMDAKRLSEIGALAATVAHELRNPLGVIFTAVFNIKRKNKNPSLEKHLANIEKHVMESNQIIDNLLSYSVIKMPNYENINIDELLDEVISSSKERLKKKRVIIVKDSISIKNIFVEADPLQIKVMFLNILNNSYDALTKNEGKIEIEGLYNGGDFIKVHFKDNGSGISKEDLKRVYEPFFSSKLKGTGLGLTLCNQIVSLHDGKLKIQSEMGKGTTVSVRLPVKQKK